MPTYWTRAELKEKAKEVLRKTYWTALLVSIVFGILGGNYGSTNKISTKSNKSESSYNVSAPIRNADSVDISFGNRYAPTLYRGSLDFLGPLKYAAYSAILIISAMIATFALLITVTRLFITPVLEVGVRRFFLDTATDAEGYISKIAFGFRGGRYWKIWLTMFMRALFNSLWYLAFVIPGIVKGYAYSMTPYILADNPELDYRRAIELSMKMTDGHKMDMFVLDLSFIGWYLLGALLLLIGTVFVWPYENATKAQLYLKLRDDAIARGLTTYEELSLREGVVYNVN